MVDLKATDKRLCATFCHRVQQLEARAGAGGPEKQKGPRAQPFLRVVLSLTELKNARRTNGHVVHIFFPQTRDDCLLDFDEWGCRGWSHSSGRRGEFHLSLGHLPGPDATISPHVLKSVPSRFKDLQGKVVVL